MRPAKNMRQCVISWGLCTLQKDEMSVKTTNEHEGNRKILL